MRLPGAGTIAAVIMLWWLLGGCERPGRPKEMDPVRFKFTLTVLDDGVEKSASSVVEHGEKAEYPYINLTGSQRWQLRSYTVGTATVLNLGNNKGWLAVLYNASRLVPGTKTGLTSAPEGGAGSPLYA
jgi:hypothetical protein